MLKRGFLTFIISFLCSIQLFSQIDVSSRIIEDSIKVGAEFRLSLTVSYPATVNILYPDTSYKENWKPAEYVSHKYYPSVKIDSLRIKDSAVYYLRTFSLDSFQSIRPTVRRINSNGDTLNYISNKDSIAISFTLPANANLDSLRFKDDFSTYSIPRTRNILLYAILLGGAIILVILVYFFFGNKIKNYLKLRKARNDYSKFIKKFDLAADQADQSLSETTINATLILWRAYLAKTDEIDALSFSTTELYKTYQNDFLLKNLRIIDEFLYAGKPLDHIKGTLGNLKAFAHERFQAKIKRITDG